MNVSRKSLILAVLSSSLASCVSTSDDARLCADEQGEFYACQDLSVALSTQTKADASLYSSPLHFQLLSDYTEQMAAELQSDLAGKSIEDKIIVASFVYLDSGLRSTNRLGNQLAELFIHDLQEIGLPVRDHRLADALTIKAAGDFAMTREGDELKFNRSVGYVLLGTLLENKRGLIINARLVNAKTQQVAAASSKLLPSAIFLGL